jgi:hypothetical protein
VALSAPEEEEEAGEEVSLCRHVMMADSGFLRSVSCSSLHRQFWAGLLGWIIIFTLFLLEAGRAKRLGLQRCFVIIPSLQAQGDVGPGG